MSLPTGEMLQPGYVGVLTAQQITDHINWVLNHEGVIAGGVTGPTGSSVTGPTGPASAVTGPTGPTGATG